VLMPFDSTSAMHCSSDPGGRKVNFGIGRIWPEPLPSFYRRSAQGSARRTSEKDILLALDVPEYPYGGFFLETRCMVEFYAYLGAGPKRRHG
jgi:hypothetical protein